METLITDLAKPLGEKLIEVQAMSNENYYDDLYFNCTEEWRFLAQMEIINKKYPILGE